MKSLYYHVSIKKKTQHAPRDVYQFVPLLDFTVSSEIEWSVSIPEIDAQLYKRYNLSDDLIRAIEERVRYRDGTEVDEDADVLSEDDDE